MTVRLADGVHIERPDGPDVVADSRRAVGDVNVVSHAHTDHLLRTEGAPVRCSSATAALGEVRTGTRWSAPPDDDGIELLPAGHVLGSTAVFIDGDPSYLYTGDVSPRDRLYLDGFEPVGADVLVVEATYGRSGYRFPPQPEIEAAIGDWVLDNADRPILCFGYALGRAQKLQAVLTEVGGIDVSVAEPILEMNEVFGRVAGIEFEVEPFEADRPLRGGDVVVVPPSARRTAPVERLESRDGALTAGFSGWAVNESYRYRGRYDAAFPLSDHADFEELLGIVRGVDPSLVYTTHGFDEDLAVAIQRELGVEARPLRRGQRRLDEF